MPGLVNLKLDLPDGMYFPGRHSLLFLSPVFRLCWQEHAGHGQSEKHGTAGCETPMDLKAPLNLNKELMKRTVHLQVACALAKLLLKRPSFLK